jgi:hypothetical protein
VCGLDEDAWVSEAIMRKVLRKWMGLFDLDMKGR